MRLFFFSPLLSVSDVNETHKTSPQPAIELHKIITQKNTEEHIKEYTKENPHLAITERGTTKKQFH